MLRGHGRRITSSITINKQRGPNALHIIEPPLPSADADGRIKGFWHFRIDNIVRMDGVGGIYWVSFFHDFSPSLGGKTVNR